MKKKTISRIRKRIVSHPKSAIVEIISISHIIFSPLKKDTLYTANQKKKKGKNTLNFLLRKVYLWGRKCLCGEATFLYISLSLYKSYLSSILHLLSLTLQCVLKSSNSFKHFLSCWHTDNAWLHVGNASIGYGSFSAIIFFPHQVPLEYTNDEYMKMERRKGKTSKLNILLLRFQSFS